MIKSKTKNIIIIVSISVLAAVIIGIVVSMIISKAITPDPEKFVDYVCYDANLKALEVRPELKTNYKSTGESGAFQDYKKIVGESDDDFIAVRAHLELIPFYGYDPGVYIAQPPENAINVWEDWTIKEIQLCTAGKSYKKEIEDFTPGEPNFIFNSTNDEIILSEFKKAVQEGPKDHDFRSEQAYLYVCKDIGTVRIRVLFNESDNIIWETELRYFNNARSFYLNYDMIYKHAYNEIINQNKIGAVRLDNDSNLYSFIIETLSKYEGEANSGIFPDPST